MSLTLARPQAPWALRLLPPFPAIAQRVLAIVGQEDIAVRELGELVKMDPSFAAELLRFANSALFGIRHEVKSISQAIILLGLDRIKTMATLVAVNRMVRSSARKAALRKIWIHSLATAVIAEQAARVSSVAADTAYTAGLLHNLGTLGLMSAYPEEYSRMLDVTQEYGFDLLQTERDLFDIDHCLAGCYLAQDWEFPDELAAAIAVHHEDPVAGEASLDNVVKVSWRLSDTLGYVAFPPDKLWLYDELVAFLPNASSFARGRSQEELKAAVDERLAAAPI
ncbi:MAG TPA: HDOD domain-containing protein [Bryobacteraceae bacterium]|nr:HDOD domain-containing protein [Bryobacteraceae bacterium]HUI54457.1 HDOD domain-containing protein [Bryobacteraceae bacterium]